MAHWAILPSRSTATRSASESASSWSWVTSSVVVDDSRRILATSSRTLAAQLRVERGERLVQQHDLGFDRERAGQGDALLLAAGELVGIAAREPAEADELEQLVDSLPRAARGSPKAMFACTVRWGNRPPSWGT